MTENSQSTDSTRQSLLLRVRDLSNQMAWNEFVGLYAPRIHAWCLRWELQESDAADVTQEVLCKLVQALREFEYDRSRGAFRAWLKTITGNTVRDLVRDWKKPGRARAGSVDDAVLQSLESPAAVDGLMRQIEAAHDQEVLRAAESQVRQRVETHTWDAYRLTAVEQRTPADAARQLGMPIAEVYVAKSRVLRMLREEVRKIDAEGSR